MCGRMAGGGSERSAVLVIRVWTEVGAEADALRARMTQVLDLSQRETSEVVAGSRGEIVARGRVLARRLFFAAAFVARRPRTAPVTPR